MFFLSGLVNYSKKNFETVTLLFQSCSLVTDYTILIFLCILRLEQNYPGFTYFLYFIDLAYNLSNCNRSLFSRSLLGCRFLGLGGFRFCIFQNLGPPFSLQFSGPYHGARFRQCDLQFRFFNYKYQALLH